VQNKNRIAFALPGNPAVFRGDPWFSDPAFLRVWLCLKKIVIEARNPTATAPPQPFTFQRQAAFIIN
jgi:hypothetical protein